MPSMKPKCHNCGELLPIEIEYADAKIEVVTGGTINTGSASSVIRTCKKCGDPVVY